MATCPNCGNQTGEGAIFCDQCGSHLPSPVAVTPEPAAAPSGGSIICPACGAGNVPGEAFCDFCGSPLAAPVPSTDVVPDLEPVSSEAELEVTPAPESTAPAAEEVSVPAVSEKSTCPACGAEAEPDEAFCADCGASLAQAPIPPEPVVEIEPEPVVEAEPVIEPVVAEESAPPVPEPVVEEAPPPTPAPAGPPQCPACGSEYEAGDAFCSTCGFALGAAAAPAPAAPAAPVTPPAPVSVGPLLVVSASGAEIPLPAGSELLIGREDPVSGIYPEIDLTPHGGEDGGVSRRHARLILEGGAYFVEDLDSTNFTFVNKQKLAPKSRHPLTNGDELRCGRVSLVLRI